MALTRSFKETIKAPAEHDAEFRTGLFEEAVAAFLDGDIETGKVLLRDYVNATVGFSELGKSLDKNPKSLMRMLSSQGNPRADNLFALLAHLKTRDHLTVTCRPNTHIQTN